MIGTVLTAANHNNMHLYKFVYACLCIFVGETVNSHWLQDIALYLGIVLVNSQCLHGQKNLFAGSNISTYASWVSPRLPRPKLQIKRLFLLMWPWSVHCYVHHGAVPVHWDHSLWCRWTMGKERVISSWVIQSKSCQKWWQIAKWK